MENQTTARKQIMEGDIQDLITKIQSERRADTIYESNEYGYRIAIPNSIDTYSKNYSTYKKLIDSLRKLVNTYKNLDWNNYHELFMSKLIECLNKEIEDVHVLMKESLDRSNNDQYRCLNDCYITLIELVDNIEKSKPRRPITIDGNSKEIGEVILTAYKAFERKKILRFQCINDKLEQSINNFYKTENPLFKTTGVLPICKKCLNDMCFNIDKSFNLEGFKNAIKWLEVEYDEELLKKHLEKGFSLIWYKKEAVLKGLTVK